MARRVSLYRWDELPLDKVTEMVARKVVASDQVRLTQVYFKKGAIAPQHGHASDILIYVLQGALRVRLGGDDLMVREGEVLVVPGGVVHEAEALDDTFMMTVETVSGTTR